MRCDIGKRIGLDGVREKQVNHVIQTRYVHDLRNVFGLQESMKINNLG
jgi:hypothetical protein